MISEAEGLDLWRRAKAHPVGIAVRTDNRFSLTQRLYQIRARNQEDFSDMMLRHGPDESEVWVVHRPSAGEGKVVPMKPMEEGDLDEL